MPGVYIVFWMKNSRCVEIPRMLRIDRKGVLYIGSSKKLKNRLRNLWISLQMARSRAKRKKYPHTFGPSLIYTGLIDRILDEELMICFKHFKNENYAKDQEKLALLKYTRYYGEPPPLNLNVGRKYFLILGLGEVGTSRLVPKLDADIKNALGVP